MTSCSHIASIDVACCENLRRNCLHRGRHLRLVSSRKCEVSFIVSWACIAVDSSNDTARTDISNVSVSTMYYPNGSMATKINMVLGSAVSSPSGVRSRAPEKFAFWTH